MATQPIQLFISHSSQDCELGERLADLVRSALNLPPSAIRCTSVDGYQLPGGADTNEQLKREVHDSVAFIGIVSSDSVRSIYVLFELGARWGAGKHLIPLLAPGTPASALGGPLAGLNALRCDSRAQLHQLLEELASKLGVPLQSGAVFEKHLGLVAATRAPKPQGEPPNTSIAVTSSGKGLLEAHVRVLELLAEAGDEGLSTSSRKYGNVFCLPDSASAVYPYVRGGRAVCRDRARMSSPSLGTSETSWRAARENIRCRTSKWFGRS